MTNVDESYAYLSLSLSLLALVAILLYFRKDLARRTLKLGLVGGLVGIFSELFYFRDYWQPLSLAGHAKVSIEDFFFGFAVTALAVIIYPVVARTSFSQHPTFPQHRVRYVAIFIASMISMYIFSVLLGINSIFVSYIIFTGVFCLIIYKRPDLIDAAFKSALIFSLISIVFYMVLFNIMFPNVVDKFWLLTGTVWGEKVLGNIPITEILWYFSYSLLASVSYPYVSGKTFENNENHQLITN